MEFGSSNCKGIFVWFCKLRLNYALHLVTAASTQLIIVQLDDITAVLHLLLRLFEYCIFKAQKCSEIRCEGPIFKSFSLLVISSRFDTESLGPRQMARIESILSTNSSEPLCRNEQHDSISCLKAFAIFRIQLNWILAIRPINNFFGNECGEQILMINELDEREKLHAFMHIYLPYSVYRQLANIHYWWMRCIFKYIYMRYEAAVRLEWPAAMHVFQLNWFCHWANVMIKQIFLLNFIDIPASSGPTVNG